MAISSSQKKRQMMQQWPACLMTFSKSEEAGSLPQRYSRVPTTTSTSKISNSNSTSPSSQSADWDSRTREDQSEDSAANLASPFNSKAALLPAESPLQSLQHYYAENLTSCNQGRIYDDYKQRDHNLDKHYASTDLANLMDPENPKSNISIMQFEKEKASTRMSTFGTQVIAALAVSLASMFVGFSTSYTSPALASMKESSEPFKVEKSMETWIGSILPLSALFGGLSGGACITYLGRRNTILGSAFPFIIAQVLIAMAINPEMVLAGRALCGFCVGVVSLALPVYLAETLQPEVRGTLGIFPTTFGNIGILAGSTIGMYLNWSDLALFGITMPAAFLICMLLIPETPRWFISKGKTKKARKSLQWLRGKNADVTEELNAIEKVHIDSEKQETRPMDLFTGSNLKPVLVSLGLMLFQQMSGINAIIFYTVSIFKDSGSDMDGNVSSTIVTGVNLCSTFVATFLIDRLGRKILLYVSSVFMTVALLLLGYFFYAKAETSSPIMMEFVKNYNFLPLASLVIYVIGFSLGFGPIPWLMMGEILPAKIRGSAASLATAFNWSCTFLVTKFFTIICDQIGQHWTFWGFACICFVGLVFTVICVPETSGRSLEEIENRLTGPVRRMSAVANMKPMPTAC